MKNFNVRALEIHSAYAWDYDWVLNALNFMSENHMNTLILHRNDFIDLIIYPGKYFGNEGDRYPSIFSRYKEIFRKLYKYTPTRRSGPFQRRAYLNRLIKEAADRNIDIYIENKELYFPEIILEFFPQLVKEGTVCPNEPFWREFTEVKFREFFQEFPQIKGIITAVSTGESKVSINSNRCTCELCQNTTKETWYKNTLMSMYKSIHEAGKTLVVRDFVFDSKSHGEITSVMEELPEDVIISLKNTPHDYYITFPDNARIGHVGDHEQWVEYDAMGQYFGWGVGIAALIDEYKNRMEYAHAKQVDGIVIRTDWESLDGHSAFKSINKINLYAGAALSEDLNRSPGSIIRQYLEKEKFIKEEIGPEEKTAAIQWFLNIMYKTAAIAKKTCYVNGCVFSDSSTIPVSLDHAFWLSLEKNSLKDWDPAKDRALDVTIDNIHRILAEKDLALQEITELNDQISKGNNGLTEEANQFLKDCFSTNVLYVRTFRIVTAIIFLTKYKSDHKDGYYDELFEQYRKDLVSLTEELDLFFKNTNFPHIVYTLLDSERLRTLYEDSMSIGKE